ncbi:hypothetical protein VTK26DRAFT_7398 [Humicola hyalothermophila]
MRSLFVSADWLSWLPISQPQLSAPAQPCSSSISPHIAAVALTISFPRRVPPCPSHVRKRVQKIASRRVGARFRASYSLTGPVPHDGTSEWTGLKLTSPAAAQFLDPRDSHSTKVPSNDAANPCPDFNPSSADATAMRATTEGAKEAEASAIPFPLRLLFPRK